MAELAVTSQMAGNKVKRYTVHPFWYFSRISHNSKFGDQLKFKIDHEHSESQTVHCQSHFRWKVHFNRIFYDSNFILLFFMIIKIRPLFLRKLVTKLDVSLRCPWLK